MQWTILEESYKKGIQQISKQCLIIMDKEY